MVLERRQLFGFGIFTVLKERSILCAACRSCTSSYTSIYRLLMLLTLSPGSIRPTIHPLFQIYRKLLSSNFYIVLSLVELSLQPCKNVCRITIGFNTIYNAWIWMLYYRCVFGPDKTFFFLTDFPNRYSCQLSRHLNNNNLINGVLFIDLFICYHEPTKNISTQPCFSVQCLENINKRATYKMTNYCIPTWKAWVKFWTFLIW